MRLSTFGDNVKGASSRFDELDGINPIIQEFKRRLDRRGIIHVQTGHAPVRAEPWIRETNAKLRGDAVLVDQATEPVGSLDPVDGGELPKGRVGDWDLKVDPAVRSLIVVMLDELPKDRLRCRSLRISSQSRHSVLAVRTNLSAIAFA